MVGASPSITIFRRPSTALIVEKTVILSYHSYHPCLPRAAVSLCNDPSIGWCLLLDAPPLCHNNTLSSSSTRGFSQVDRKLRRFCVFVHGKFLFHRRALSTPSKATRTCCAHVYHGERAQELSAQQLSNFLICRCLIASSRRIVSKGVDPIKGAR